MVSYVTNIKPDQTYLFTPRVVQRASLPRTSFEFHVDEVDGNDVHGTTLQPGSDTVTGIATYSLDCVRDMPLIDDGESDDESTA